jgi:hypothetical protein
MIQDKMDCNGLGNRRSVVTYRVPRSTSLEWSDVDSTDMKGKKIANGFLVLDISGIPLHVRKAPGLSSMGGGSLATRTNIINRTQTFFEVELSLLDGVRDLMK